MTLPGNRGYNGSGPDPRADRKERRNRYSTVVNRVAIQAGTASLGRGVCPVLVGVCLLAAPAVSRATEFEMAKLPVTEPNLCLACHLVTNPTPTRSDLNPFGADFLANGRIWDLELASLDSDGDGCLNGVEIGDSDGDGRADGNVTEQTGNPGVPDECGSGSLVDEELWGNLKAMFDGR